MNSMDNVIVLFFLFISNTFLRSLFSLQQHFLFRRSATFGRCSNIVTMSFFCFGSLFVSLLRSRGMKAARNDDAKYLASGWLMGTIEIASIIRNRPPCFNQFFLWIDVVLLYFSIINLYDAQQKKIYVPVNYSI